MFCVSRIVESATKYFTSCQRKFTVSNLQITVLTAALHLDQPAKFCGTNYVCPCPEPSSDIETTVDPVVY